MRRMLITSLGVVALALASPVIADNTDPVDVDEPAADTTPPATSGNTRSAEEPAPQPVRTAEPPEPEDPPAPAPQPEESAAEEAEPEEEEQEVRYIKPRGVPVYLEPDVAALRLARLQAQQEVTVVEEQYGWLHVRGAGGVQGWVETGDTTEQAPPRAEARAVDSIPELRVERVMNPWWTAGGTLLGFLIGLIATYKYMDMRMRRRYGGMRMKL